ncbi:MAG: hypothetical protein ABL961_18200 [Vicinamibacterales bacterium]
MRAGDVPLASLRLDLLDEVEALWVDIAKQFPRPDPPRTPVGVVAAELVEHIHHAPAAGGQVEVLQWNFEFMRAGSAVKSLTPQAVNLSALSSRSKAAIGELDQLAREVANRRYLRAIQEN